MTAINWPQSYSSHRDFYHEAYGQHILSSRAAGSLGAHLIAATQPAGDWSDAPTPDLVIGYVPTQTVGLNCDLGAGRFQTTMRSGDAIIIAPGAGASIQTAGQHVCRVLSLPYANVVDLAAERGEHLPEDGDFGSLHRAVQSSKSLTALLAAFWTEAEAPSRLREDGLLLQVLACLLSLNRGKVEPLRGGLAPWQERRCTEYLRDNMTVDVDLPTLARVANLSTFHFARMFKKTTGVPPHRYQLLLRLERAKELLLSTEVSIIEVALSVGYDSPQTLARLFQRELGVTPSAWRRERRR